MNSRLAYRVLDVLECFSPLIAFVIATSVLASPLDQTRGGNLKRRQYQTSATIALFVDPAGSDSNSCTSSTTACLTIAGAFSKLPRFVQNNGTITVASGAYTTGFVSSAFPTPIVIGQGFGITVQGTMANSTVATGTATGTCTSAAAGSSAGPATCTDSGQAWTVNDLRGKFITFASGSLSGQSFPIVTNSATVVTFPSTTSSGTVAYSIQEPGAVFTTTSANLPLNFSGNGNLSLTNLKFVVTAGNGFTYSSTAVTGINLTYTSVSISASSTGMSIFSGLHTMRRSYVTSSGGAAVSILHTNPTWSPSFTSTNSYLRVTSASAFNGIQFANQTQMGAAPISATSIDVTTGIGAYFQYGQTGQNIGLWVTCTTPGSGVGVTIGTPVSASSTGTLASQSFASALRVTGCGIGFRVPAAPASASVANAAFDTVSIAFYLEKGGIIDFINGTPTFTAVTTELYQDNVNYTFADLTALPVPQVISNTYGSRYIR